MVSSTAIIIGISIFFIFVISIIVCCILSTGTVILGSSSSSKKTVTPTFTNNPVVVKPVVAAPTVVLPTYSNTLGTGKCHGTEMGKTKTTVTSSTGKAAPIATQLTTTTLQNCQLICDSNNSCAGYDWDSVSNQCNIYSPLNNLNGDLSIPTTTCMYNKQVWNIPFGGSSATLNIGNISTSQNLTINLFPPGGHTSFNSYTCTYTGNSVIGAPTCSIVTDGTAVGTHPLKQESQTVHGTGIDTTPKLPDGWTGLTPRKTFSFYTVKTSFSLVFNVSSGMSINLSNFSINLDVSL